ncbi:DNA polymerase III subunit alpha [Photobacterium leiognathi]|uniref:DNA polymerase III subunit alpha n=1 Tax=Photobacterium leiognathi TaxID=553611 RepID=UPI0029811497|nr:DNA polymerase III subunit alpha [Photobacterium leiognathi]
MSTALIHTEHSLVYGSSTVKDYVKKASDLGVHNLIICDYLSTAGVIDVYKSLIETKDVNVFIGATFSYISDITLKSFLKRNNILDLFESVFNSLDYTLVPCIVNSYKVFNRSSDTTDFLNKVTRSRTLSDQFKELVKANAESSYSLISNLSQIMPSPDVVSDNVVLVAKNVNGYYRLNRLISTCFREGQHGYVQLKGTSSSERHVSSYPKLFDSMLDGIEDLVLLTGTHNDGLDNSYDVMEYLQSMVSLFDYVVPVVNYGYTEDDIYDDSKRSWLRQLAKIDAFNSLGLEYVEINSVRFVNRDDFKSYLIKSSTQSLCSVFDPYWVPLSSSGLYLSSKSNFSDHEFVWDANSLLWRVDLELDKPVLPVYDSNLSSEDDELSRLCLLSLSKFNLDNNQIYQSRLELELTVIRQTGYAGYFLIVMDLIQHALRIGVPVGPGRGSGGGSLVAFLLEITAIDPVKHDLYFERFLNSERASMPDFDIDFATGFCPDTGSRVDRSNVIEYVNNKYSIGGNLSVAQITATTKYSGKASLKSISSAFDQSVPCKEYLASLIVDSTLDKSGRFHEKSNLKSLSTKSPLLAYALSVFELIYGTKKNVSTHAAGIVISRGDISRFTALTSSYSHVERMVTQLDKDQVESVGLVKFDFLIVETLSVISECLSYIKNKGVNLTYRDIPSNDPGAFDLLSKKLTSGIFQLGSSGMTSLAFDMKIKTLEELCVCIALYRPGPINSKITESYVKRSNDLEDKLPIHPMLTDLLSDTNQLIIYQEQVMGAARVLAGFTLAEADLLRRAMGKKKPEEMEALKTKFINGCALNGINTSDANRIFETIEMFSGYAFNKSHSLAYAMIASQTLYLKKYYPLEFYTAYLNSKDCPVFISNAIKSYREFRVKVLPPSINDSYSSFTPENNSTRYGFSGINGLGESTSIKIVSERETNGSYDSLSDFINRVKKCSRTNIRKLIISGAFDRVPSKFDYLFIDDDYYQDFIKQEEILERIKLNPTTRANLIKEWKKFDGAYGRGIRRLLHLCDLFEEDLSSQTVFNKKDILDVYFEEVCLVGSTLSSRLLDLYIPESRRRVLGLLSPLNYLNNPTRNIRNLVGYCTDIIIWRQKTGKNKGMEMCKFSLSDGKDFVHVVAFSGVYAKYKELISSNNFVIISGVCNSDDIILNDIRLVPE